MHRLYRRSSEPLAAWIALAWPAVETLPGAAELPWAVGGCRAHRGSGLGRRSRTRVRATPAAVRTTEGDSGAPAWPDSSCTPVRLPVVLGDP